MGEKREEWYYLSTSIEKRKEKGTRERVEVSLDV